MTIAEAVASAAPTDDEVVRRVIGGDTALFEILMRRHNQRIYRAVRAVLGSDDEVEDVMQQAYLNAYQHLRQFVGDAQFSTWMTRIAVNEALGRRRKHGFIEGADEMALMLVEEKTPDPEQQASAAELREVIERQVAALPEQFRAIFVLRDVEGMSTAEAAACLGISEDLAKQRLHRARTALRGNLYRSAGVTFASIFAFGNARCDRVVAGVMTKLTTVPSPRA